jgi:ABC-type transport system involved in Fe-S cluster assembly fused permease/ATPase subunit
MQKSTVSIRAFFQGESVSTSWLRPFIESVPGGYDAQVGERGVKLPVTTALRPSEI